MNKKVIDFNRLSKQEYQKPAIQVVLLQHQAHLLADSDIFTTTITNIDGDGLIYGGGGIIDAR